MRCGPDRISIPAAGAFVGDFDLETRVTVIAFADPDARDVHAARSRLAELAELGPAPELLAIPPDADAAVVAIDAARTSPAEVVVFLPSVARSHLAVLPALAAPLLSGSSPSESDAGGRDACFGFRRRRARGGLGSQAAATLAWPLSPARDPLSGLVAVRRETVERVQPPRDPSLLGLAIAIALPPDTKVEEIPVSELEPAPGRAAATTDGVARLAGACAPRGFFWRATVAVLAAAGVDAAAFAVLRGSNALLGTAQLASLGLALAVLYGLCARFVFRGRENAPGATVARPLERSRTVSLLYAAVLAVMVLSLRGGLLEWLFGHAGLPIALALPVSFAACAPLVIAGSSFWVFGTAPAAGALAAAAAIGAALLLRAVYLGLPQLLPDEAYHWTWSTHLALSYLDHPPLTAWVIRAATGLLGQNEFAVRLPAFVAGVATIGFMYAAARDLYGKRAGLFTAALVAAAPFYFGVGVVIMPDSWLFACWALGLWLATRAVLYDEAWAWWPLGLTIGIGFLSKYNIALLGVSIAVVIFLDAFYASSGQRWLRRKEPYVAAALALACLTPVLVWNYQHDWASFGFQTARRLERDRDRGFALHWLLAHGALLLSPFVFAAALWSLLPERFHLLTAAGLPNRGDPAERRKRRFLIVLTTVPLIPFVLFAFTHQTRPHWTAAAWLSALPMVGHALASASTSTSAGASAGVGFRALSRCVAPTLVALLLLYGAGLHYVVLGLPGVPYGKTFDRYFWETAIPPLVAAEAELEREAGQTPFVAGTSKWSIAASLSYYGPPDWQTRMGSRHFFGDRASMWDLWSQPADAIGRPLLVVARKRKELENPEVLDTLEGVGPIVERTLTRDGVPLRPLYFRTARRYLGPPAPEPKAP